MKYNRNCKNGAPVILEGAEIAPVFRAMRVTCGPGEVGKDCTRAISLDEAWGALAVLDVAVLRGDDEQTETEALALAALADNLGALLMRGSNPTLEDIDKDVIADKDLVTDPVLLREREDMLLQVFPRQRLGIT